MKLFDGDNISGTGRRREKETVVRRRILIAGLGKIMLTWASEVAALCCALIYRNSKAPNGVHSLSSSTDTITQTHTGGTNFCYI